jgi:hypothetical protein
MTRKRSEDRMSCEKQAPGRVALALEIHESIAACNEYLARGNDVHALTAALMLPCYVAEFRSLVVGLTEAEENELRSALASYSRASSMESSHSAPSATRMCDATAERRASETATGGASSR